MGLLDMFDICLDTNLEWKKEKEKENLLWQCLVFTGVSWSFIGNNKAHGGVRPMWCCLSAFKWIYSTCSVERVFILTLWLEVFA